MGKSVESVTPCKIVFPEPPPKDYKFNCSHENCGKRFVKLSRLQMHQNSHLAEKPFKCSFEGCDAAYSQTSHLKRHEATRHSKSGGEYKCEFENCAASFETSSSLYFHQKRRHSLRKYKCSFCKEMFSKKFLLKEHETSHTGKNSFQCKAKDCEEAFASHASLKAHEKSHKDAKVEKVHKCLSCDAVFDKWSIYIEHTKTHLGALKVACPLCSKMFSKGNLRRHQRVHDDNKEAYCCPHEGCARFYYHIKNLTHHVRHAHEGHGFECKICLKKLCSKQKLESHIKIIHENSKPNKNLKKRTLKPKLPPYARDNVLKMLCGDTVLDVKRTGPPKGFKPTKSSKFPVSSTASASCNSASREDQEGNSPASFLSDIPHECFAGL